MPTIQVHVKHIGVLLGHLFVVNYTYVKPKGIRRLASHKFNILLDSHNYVDVDPSIKSA